MPLPITVNLDRAQARRRHPGLCGSYPTTLPPQKCFWSRSITRHS